ncbi:MAG: hypothetical protein EXR20_06680 [Bacteroidetes bacterium]|nr:hypothetical protein [Bacteroidota bacterium]
MRTAIIIGSVCLVFGSCSGVEQKRAEQEMQRLNDSISEVLRNTAMLDSLEPSMMPETDTSTKKEADTSTKK